jgi:hemoglobin
MSMADRARVFQPAGAPAAPDSGSDPHPPVPLATDRFIATMTTLGTMPRWRGRDLDDRTEIAEMVRRFYADVAQDDLLGPMFTVVARVDWSEHLPTLTAFWCRALLSEPGYEGNPYRAHLLVHARRPFTRSHFERWLDLFDETLVLGWAGPRVEQAEALARKVAAVHSKQIIGDEVVVAPPGESAPVVAEPQPPPERVAVQLRRP